MQLATDPRRQKGLLSTRAEYYRSCIQRTFRCGAIRQFEGLPQAPHTVTGRAPRDSSRR